MLSPVLRKSLATAAAGTVALTATALPTQTAYAEEQKKSNKKLSIYDEPQPQIVVVEAPTKLEEHMAYAEKFANEKLDEGKAHVQSLYDEYKRVETCVTNTIKETIDKDEEILPNGLYVGVAALAGTIIARNRNIIIRFATSTALAVGTAHYLLPKTTHNVFVQLEKLERRYPQLQSAHKSVNDAVADAQKQVQDTLAQLRGSFDESTSKLLGQVQGKDAAQEAKDKFESVKKSVESMYSTRSNPGVEETLKKNN